MSSVIELYEHNQKAYDALLDMLGERDRACIIKPTGTGNRKLSERDILSGMGAVPTKTDLGKR